MLNSIRKALQALFNRNAATSLKGRVPRAVPSAEEAIIPFNPAEHAIQPQNLKRLIDNGHDTDPPRRVTETSPFTEPLRRNCCILPQRNAQLRCRASATTAWIQASQELDWRYRSMGKGN